MRITYQNSTINSLMLLCISYWYHKSTWMWNVNFFLWKGNMPVLLRVSYFISTRPMKTKMGVWRSITTVRTSMFWYLFYLNTLTFYFRTNQDLACRAKAHAVLQRDQDGNDVRVLHKLTGFHSPGCQPTNAFLQVKQWYLLGSRNMYY